MELVALTTQQLDYLARQDPHLKPIFVGVFASDRLPKQPNLKEPQAYIVNTDPHDKAGSHWISIYTDEGHCEVMDSYGLPLYWYRSEFFPWIDSKFSLKKLTSNSMPLQSLDSNACGHYALMYLKHKARGKTMNEFLNLFEARDYVTNDHRVGNKLERLIVNEMYVKTLGMNPNQQSNFRKVDLDV